MVVYRLLGSGMTDANGVASVNYSGAGAGEMDLVASTSNPITQSSLVSDTISILDCGLIYYGIDDSQASVWHNYNSLLTVDYNGDGTRVRHTENSTTWRYFYFNSNAITTEKVGGYFAIPNNHCIEFDITAITDSEITVALYDGTNTPLAQINRNGHYKIVMDGSTATLTKDNTTNISFSPNNTLTGSYVRFGFGLNAYNEGIRFKDFKVYSI